MIEINILQNYIDNKRGNIIHYDGEPVRSNVKIIFTGSNNFLYVSNKFISNNLIINFRGNDSICVFEDAGHAEYSSHKLNLNCQLTNNSYIYIYI